MNRLVASPMLLSASKRGPAGEGGVSGDGDDVALVFFVEAFVPHQIAGFCHAEGGGECGSGVAGAVAVVLAFGAEEEAVEPLVLADGGDFVPASGEHFVDVALVADIEEQLVRGVSKTRWRAMVSSTTPRFGPRCPPVVARVLMRVRRIFSASAGRCSSGRSLTSCGPRIAGISMSSKESDFIVFFSFRFGLFFRSAFFRAGVFLLSLGVGRRRR